MTTPWLRLENVLVPEVRSRLADWASAAVRRMGPDPSWYRAAGAQAVDLLEVDDALRSAVIEVIAGLAPLVRRELGVPHFPLGSIEFVAGVRGESSLHGSSPEPTGDPGQRQIEFVYFLETASADGALRILDRDEPIPDTTPAQTFFEVPAVANSIVFFPSTVHHELARERHADPDSVHLVLRGWITSGSRPTRQVAVPDDSHRVAELQSRLLPRLSAGGFEIRPTPTAVHELLRSLLELRGGRRRPEDADREFHLGSDNDLIDVSDLAAEILSALQPLHERFSGTCLVPSALYGMRDYREGAKLAMHVDRIETHVVSSVIQVAQDVDEPWPLQLSVDGRIHEIVLGPGQLLLYEGASTMHGRVTPLRGRSFVNVFAHYRPVDWEWSVPELLERAANERN